MWGQQGSWGRQGENGYGLLEVIQILAQSPKLLGRSAAATADHLCVPVDRMMPVDFRE
jgi:hypothetical protein